MGSTLADQREILRNILESQYSDSDSMRLIEVLFMNIKTQDNRLIGDIKSRIGYRFSGGHSSVLDVCSEEIDKLTGFAISEEKPKVIILDDNELSMAKYAEEYPENFKEICDAKSENTEVNNE